MFYIKADLELIKGSKFPHGYVEGIECAWISFTDDKEKAFCFKDKKSAENYCQKIIEMRTNKKMIFSVVEE